MKEWPVGSYLVLNSNPRVPGDRPLILIVYTYIYRKVLQFIASEGSGSTEPGDPFLSHLPDIYSNVSVFPIVHPCLLGRYFNACNKIDNHNRVWKSDLVLYKYWLKHSGYFILAATVELGMVITHEKFLFCCVISEESVVKKF